jgi:hypothetical protein
MASEVLPDRYYRGVRGFFKQNHVAVMTKAEALALHYLQEVSDRESTSDEGDLDVRLWSADFIQFHYWPLAKDMDLSEIEAGMLSLIDKKFVKKCKKWVSMIGFADFQVEAMKQDERNKRRGTRAKSKGSGKTKSPKKGTLSPKKGTESQDKKTESPLSNKISKEVNTEGDRHQLHIITDEKTEVVDLDQPVAKFDGNQIQPGTNAEKIKKAFPDLPDRYCLETINKLKYWQGRLRKEFDPTLEAALANFPVGRHPIKDKNGLHGWITNWMSNRWEKMQGEQDDRKPVEWWKTIKEGKRC